MNRPRRRPLSRRGGILITALVLAAVIATLLAGLGTLIVSYYSRVTTESQYAGAINAADAGVNYEIRRINQSVNNADLPSSGTPPGATVQFGSGKFRVYCTMADGATAWDRASSPFYVFSTGTIGTVSRSVQVKLQGTHSTAIPRFGLFGTNSILLHAPNATLANGDLGTNGTCSLHAHCPNGSCYICGPGASGSGAGANCPTVNLPYALAFPTVSQIALNAFPNAGATAPGGLTYLATHNDNAKVGLPTQNATIAGSITLVGPGDYFVNSISLVGSSVISCNNTNGPINIWVGPAGSAGMANFDGTASNTVTSNDPAKAVTFYVATTAGVQMHSSPTFVANFYTVNATYGPLSGWNSPTVTGSLIGYDVFQSGNTQVNTTAGGYPAPIPFDGYGFAGVWSELNAN